MVKILKPENDGVSDLVKNVSCNPNTAGLYLLENRASSSKLAWKPHKFNWKMECSTVSSDRAENWLERTRFCSAFFSRSEAAGLGGTWGLLEGAERLGCENPSTSTRIPSTLTLVGERLEDDEPSFEAAVFKGPAEPLGALLEGAAEPLDAIFWG